MTAPQDNQTQNEPVAQQPSNKELNFRALEQKYQKQLEQERQARLEAERKAQELASRSQGSDNDDDDDGEPYIDKKRLSKTLNRFGQSTQSEIQKAMEQAKHAAKEELKQEMWLEQNPDFYDTLQHAEKFAQTAPKLAETILRMPEGFERQKLVYQNIKALGIDKPPQKESTIQDKINANQRSPYYQPSGVGTSPYATVGDFSDTGKKNAYDKMQALKKTLRLG